MVRSCGRQQVIDWHINTGKTVFEADKKVQGFAWPAMTDEEKETFLKKKKYRTKDEEKEFVRIWDKKYGIAGHATRFYAMCSHHKKPKEDGKNGKEQYTDFSLYSKNKMNDTGYYYNREYAVKYIIPVTEETKVSNVELYDRIGNGFVNVSYIDAKELVSLISEIGATGRTITEEQFNEIVNRK